MCSVNTDFITCDVISEYYVVDMQDEINCINTLSLPHIKGTAHVYMYFYAVSDCKSLQVV